MIGQDIEELLEKAKTGDIDAQELLKHHLSKKKLDDKDRFKITYFFAEKNIPEYQNKLGAYYFEGKGTSINFEEAEKWLNQAAEHKHVRAIFNLGVLFKERTDTKKDLNKALEFFKKAADLGHKHAVNYFKETMDKIKQENSPTSELDKLLSTYLKDRTNEKWPLSQKTKEYLYNPILFLQFSFTQKKAAVEALQDALHALKNPNEKHAQIDLKTHLSALRNGRLGKALRNYIKHSVTTSLLGENVNTVSDFVRVLETKVNSQNTPSNSM